MVGNSKHGVMVKELDFVIEASVFEHLLYSCTHFRTNALRKGMNPPYPPIYRLNSITTVPFYKDGFDINQPMKAAMQLNKEIKPFGRLALCNLPLLRPSVYINPTTLLRVECGTRSNFKQSTAVL